MRSGRLESPAFRRSHLRHPILPLAEKRKQREEVDRKKREEEERKKQEQAAKGKKGKKAKGGGGNDDIDQLLAAVRH
jgi:hypothetical protein